MKTIDIAQAPQTLAEFVQALTGEPVVFLCDGRPVAVLQPVQGADLETVSLSLSPTFRDIIERSKRRLRTEGGLSSEEVRKQLGSERPRQDKRPIQHQAGAHAQGQRPQNRPSHRESGGEVNAGQV